MIPNKIRQQLYTDRAMKAKTEAAMSEVIRVAMLCGMEQGYKAKEDQVKAALEVLGFGDLAFKDGHDLQE